ncbi:hypothetical protein GCK32_019282 [Trichostrongylus colubriformis]|uniref:Uncharacterized protein n=1 Tax=Trichostrongylus colubriformis TaxID=6319 RepID=A0AAN8FJJ8_TRICO
MADEHYMNENGVGNNPSYHDYHIQQQHQHQQQLQQQQQQRNVQMSRPVLQNEPSVSIVRDDIQRPLSTMQQNLLQGITQPAQTFIV